MEKSIARIKITSVFFALSILLSVVYANARANLITYSLDSFSFKDKFDVPLNSMITSDPASITGLSSSVDVQIFSGEYSINGGTFTDQSGSLHNNDEIRVRVNSSSEYGSVNSTLLQVGNKQFDFNVRTLEDPDSGWANLPIILASITQPVFPDRDFSILNFGAIGDGNTDCTAAFSAAIKACNDSGGGRVIVPNGKFLTGPIHLLSNVNLHLTDSAIINFSTNPADFLPVVYTRFEGTECYNYSPCIYAFEQENIAITGKGIIDAQGSNDNWWIWKNLATSDINSLLNMAENNVPVNERVFGSGHYLRPNMIQPYRCTNVLIDSITIFNSPMWHIHPVLCTNVTVSNVTVNGLGPNNDGCDPESCTNVWINNCYFNTGDDCIAIKSGRNADGRRVNKATSNVIIQNCKMKDGHGGVVIGSEITGGANHIFAENCLMDSPNLQRALRIKTNSIRGGLIEKIYLRNITVGQVSNEAIRVNFTYGEGDISTYVPIVRDVEVRNLTCNQANYAVQFLAYDRSPVQNFRLIHCTFGNVNHTFDLNYYKNFCLDSVVVDGSEYHKIWNPDGNSNPFVTKISSTVLNSNFDFAIIPNPVTNHAELMVNLPEKSPLQIKLLDFTGREIRDHSVNNPFAGTQSIPLSFENIKPGIYLILVESNYGNSCKKVIVN